MIDDGWMMARSESRCPSPRRSHAPAALLCCALLTAPIAHPPADDPIPPRARESLDRAVTWLLRAQNRDGSWGDNAGSAGEVGNTCIATVALLSTGSMPTRGKHWRAIQRALDWLRPRTRGFGSGATMDQHTLLQGKLGRNIDLYLTSLLYSQIAGQAIQLPDDQRILDELQRAAARISALQKENGAWEVSYEPMLTTICAWLALRCIADAGVPIAHGSPQRVVRYLKEDCLEPGTGIFREDKWGRQERFVTQAGGLRVLYGMGEGLSAEGRLATQVVLGMEFDQDVGGRSGGEEFLGAVFATQALHHETDEPAWEVWYGRIIDALRRCQNGDGSWTGHHCITGRVFCTACSIITMTTPLKMLPMIER